MQNLNELLELAKTAAIRAGEEILRFYSHKGFDDEVLAANSSLPADLHGAQSPGKQEANLTLPCSAQTANGAAVQNTTNVLSNLGSDPHASLTSDKDTSGADTAIFSANSDGASMVGANLTDDGVIYDGINGDNITNRDLADIATKNNDATSLCVNLTSDRNLTGNLADNRDVSDIGANKRFLNGDGITGTIGANLTDDDTPSANLAGSFARGGDESDAVDKILPDGALDSSVTGVAYRANLTIRRSAKNQVASGIVKESSVNISSNLTSGFAAGDLTDLVNEKFEINLKPDHSPVTSADLVANEAIFDTLKSSNLPVCSEEQILREDARIFWLIDPLDGTKDFIEGSGEFCVCIALIDSGRPALGIIYVPVTGEIYYAIKGEKTQKQLYKNGKFKPQILPIGTSPKTIISGKRGKNITASKLARTLKFDIVRLSSAIKFCRVAQNLAGVYLRYSPSYIWDNAAGEAIANGMGAKMIDLVTLAAPVYSTTRLKNNEFVLIAKDLLDQESEILRAIKGQI